MAHGGWKPGPHCTVCGQLKFGECYSQGAPQLDYASSLQLDLSESSFLRACTCLRKERPGSLVSFRDSLKPLHCLLKEFPCMNISNWFLTFHLKELPPRQRFNFEEIAVHCPCIRNEQKVLVGVETSVPEECPYHTDLEKSKGEF